MVKKKYNLTKQISLKINYIEQFLNFLLTRSLSQNQFLNPLNRISFFMKSEEDFNFLSYFSTYQKLHCLISLSPKVPNKSYYYSRFFFNKQLNYLVYANTFK